MWMELNNDIVYVEVIDGQAILLDERWNIPKDIYPNSNSFIIWLERILAI